MLLLGTLALLQIVFLPGYLLLRLMGVERKPLRTLVLSFGLSQLINYVLVFGLVAVGAYRSTVLYALFAAEVATLLWCERWIFAQSLQAVLNAWWNACRRLIPLPNDDWRTVLQPAHWRTTLRAAGLLAVWLMVAAYGQAELGRLGDIFLTWDSVCSWNRWAIVWAQNQIPQHTVLYPQLLPANCSITYVFLQDTGLWCFAKAFMFLYCFYGLLAVLDLYYETGDYGYVPGTACAFWLLTTVYHYPLSSGYADVPVGFFALATVYCLGLARQATNTVGKSRYILLGAVLAAATAVTKQMGLSVAGIYPLLAWVLTQPEPDPAGQRPSRWQQLPALIQATLLIGLLACPWYVYKIVQIHLGADVSNIWYLATDPYLHAHRGFLERSLYGIQITLPQSTFVLAIIGLFFAVRDPVQRWSVLLIIVPYYLIWLTVFPYDSRNLAMIAPLGGVAVGVGLMSGAKWLLSPRPKPQKAPRSRMWASLTAGQALAAIALLLLAVSLCIPRDSFLRHQHRRQQRVGMENVDEKLYAYHARHAIDRDIVSNYWFLPWLPGLSEHFVQYSRYEFDSMSKAQHPRQDFEEYRAAYERPSVGFAYLCMKYTDQQIAEYMDQAVAAGKASLVMEDDFNWFGKCRLYKKVPAAEIGSRSQQATTR